jgi:hypothetical protein
MTTLAESSGLRMLLTVGKTTAWCADRDVAKSEYEVLASNGRLELDLLDRLEEKLGGKPSGPRVGSGSTVQTPKAKLDLFGNSGRSDAEHGGGFASSGGRSDGTAGAEGSQRETREATDRRVAGIEGD